MSIEEELEILNNIYCNSTNLTCNELKKLEELITEINKRRINENS